MLTVFGGSERGRFDPLTTGWPSPRGLQGTQHFGTHPLDDLFGRRRAHVDTLSFAVNSNSGNPDSAMVGVSLTRSDLAADVTASGRSFLVLKKKGIAVAMVEISIVLWPPSTAIAAGLPPLYGTGVTSILAASLRSSPVTCWALPLPLVRIAELARAGARERDHVVDRLYRHRRMHADDVRIGAYVGNADKIFLRIEGQFGAQHGIRNEREAGDQDRVPVGRRLRNVFGADHRARTRTVVDHHALVERFR